MGILGLRKIIAQHAPSSITTVSAAGLAGKRIGIDASIGVYELHHISIKHNIIGTTGMHINHIQGTFHRIVKYLTAGIIPVFIFDGKPPDLKAGVITARRELKAQGKGVKVPTSIFTDVMRLLQLMKIPYVIAPSEAEAQSARMCADGVLDAVATQDTDVLTFGAKCQIIGIDGKETIAIDRTRVIAEMGLSNSQFIDFCILLGSDYTEVKLPGVGPKRALTLVRKYGSIEAICAGEKIEVPNGFTFKEARAEFERPNTVRVDTVFTAPTYTAEEIAILDKFLTDSGLTKARYSLAMLRIAAR